MAEYIERDVALREAKYAAVRGLDPVAFVEDVPVDDVAPVVHGRWLKLRNGGTSCSRCGHYTQYKGRVLDMSEAIACPWCGAKMGGRE